MEPNNSKQPPESDRRPSERKLGPMGGNLVWYLLALGVGTLFLVSLLGPDRRVQIHIGELNRLVELGPSDDGRDPAVIDPEIDPYIDVADGKEGKESTVRYGHLADLTFGAQEITGTVSVGKPGETEAKPDVSFYTPCVRVSVDALFEMALGKDPENPDRKRKAFPNVRTEEAPSGWQAYLPMLVVMSLIILVFFFMMRRVGGAGGAMAFGRSRGKLFAQEDLGVDFDDVAGIDEAVEELREVVDFLRTPEKYQILGGRIPKGVLLVGPPGTGKTLLAKVIAGEAGVPFFSISGSDFVEMFVGVGAARVRDMFQQAQAKSPCIIFIDELDALGKTRGTSVVGGHDEREQTLNALLVEMDGFTSNSGVIVMAATNRPETLDPALLRPGRFDRHVLVDRPDVRGREAILKVHVTDVKLDESINLREVAGITSGFVGADLANLVNEAALLAARKDKKTVTMQEFTEGVERVTAGLEKRQRIIHEDEKQRVAYHESAHALVACSLPNTDPVHKVSIIPRGLAALGYTLQRPEGDRYLLTQSELESRIQVLLAGTVAEEMIFDDVSTGAQNDLERATEIARSMVMDYGMSRLGRVNYRESGRSVFLGGADQMPRERSHSEHTAREIDQEIQHIIEQSQEKVQYILRERRKALVALADRLIEKEVVDNEELHEVIETNSASPMIVPGTTAKPKRPAAEKSKLPDAEAAEGG
ncbi:MAG TPA: ATP-dependent zinc metalloprotease FtsH [Thermoguttaceae bacterium]|nr:ATP-dependent zinc metalloprotease FtsH [Thermoguttaceae bacterium]